MKTFPLKSVAGLLLSALMFTSCDLFDKADDVSFSSDFENSIIVSETSTGVNVAYADEIVVDATSNAEVNKYKSKIKEFKVNKITYTITDYSLSTQAVTTSGAVAYSNASAPSAQAVTLSTVTNLNLQQASSAGTVFELNVPDAELQKIAALLKDDKAVKFHLIGVLSSAPVAFKVKFHIDAKVTASAL